MHFNWLTSKAQARRAGGKGMGACVVESITAGETVAAFGGWVADEVELKSLPAERVSRTMQIDDHLYLVSGETADPGDYVNHSCTPNCGLAGNMLVVAMRDIAIGEELTFDYAMSDGGHYDEFECLCESNDCRGVVTGRDWRLPELQSRYAGWFSPYLARKIERQGEEI
ncbi:MAG: SET domain-containing protein-lysine N-methyltransferase [Actinomycetota bacterium]